MQLRAALLSAVVLCAAYAPAGAVEPVGAPSFNIQTNIDLKALNTGNFYDVLGPAAKAEGPNRLLRLRRIGEGPLRRDHPPLRGQVRRQGRLPSGRRRAGGAAAHRRQDRRAALARRCLLDAERPGPRRQRGRHHRQPAAQHHAAERAGPQRERRHRLARLRPWRHRRALPSQPDGHRLRHPCGGARAASRNPSPSFSLSPRPTRRRWRSPTRPRAARAAASSRPPSWR